ncbi:MAG: alpha/beta hydrolase, partial [Cyanobacteria bacterium P01_C01_bin.118]
MVASRKWLLSLGVVTLLAPIVLGLVLVGLHWLGVINAWVFPLFHVGVFCIFGGVSCLITAQV